jgi:2-polyprenyl-6-methoxyphenol hydroxylase-like FAD-dependent oxidoreductase
MRAVCLGGGPGGLYFAISLKRRDPAHEVVVVERNRPDDTFGWGVVLSDETLANLQANDPESAARVRDSFVIGTISRCTIAVRPCARVATAFRESAASGC